MRPCSTHSAPRHHLESRTAQADARFSSQQGRRWYLRAPPLWPATAPTQAQGSRPWLTASAGFATKFRNRQATDFAASIFSPTYLLFGVLDMASLPCNKRRPNMRKLTHITIGALRGLVVGARLFLAVSARRRGWIKGTTAMAEELKLVEVTVKGRELTVGTETFDIH